MKNLLLSGFALLVLALTIPAIAADQPAPPADGIKLNNAQKDVTFNHTSHKEVQCGICHHQVEGKENFGKCNTAGCHDSMDRKDKSVKGYYHVIHDKGTKFKNCLGCHLEVAQAKPEMKKELTACKGSKCHP